VDTMSTANTMTSGLDCASPESIMEPTNRTAAGDQYSLGCILYFFLTGRYPFPEGSAVEKMMAHQYKQPTPIRELTPGVPSELEEIVERLMQKTPEARYSSCDEVVEALRPLAGTAAPSKPVRPAAGRTASAENGQPGAAGGRAGAGAGRSEGSRLGSRPDTTGRAAASRQETARPEPAAKQRGLRQELGVKAGGPAAPVGQPKRELPPEIDDEEEEEETAEGDEEYEGDEEDTDAEGRAGTIMIIVGVVLVCILAFWLAYKLFSHS